MNSVRRQMGRLTGFHLAGNGPNQVANCGQADPSVDHAFQRHLRVARWMMGVVAIGDGRVFSPGFVIDLFESRLYSFQVLKADLWTHERPLVLSVVEVFQLWKCGTGFCAHRVFGLIHAGSYAFLMAESHHWKAEKRASIQLALTYSIVDCVFLSEIDAPFEGKQTLQSQ